MTAAVAIVGGAHRKLASGGGDGLPTDDLTCDLNPGNLSLLWQENAMSSLVTTAGQSVAAIGNSAPSTSQILLTGSDSDRGVYRTTLGPNSDQPGLELSPGFPGDGFSTNGTFFDFEAATWFLVTSAEDDGCLLSFANLAHFIWRRASNTFGANLGSSVTGTAAITSGYKVYALRVNPAGPNTVEFWVNGVLEASSTSSIGSGAITGATLELNEHTTRWNCAQQNFLRLLGYANASVDIEAVTATLAALYGISL